MEHQSWTSECWRTFQEVPIFHVPSGAFFPIPNPVPNPQGSAHQSCHCWRYSYHPQEQSTRNKHGEVRCGYNLSNSMTRSYTQIRPYNVWLAKAVPKVLCNLEDLESYLCYFICSNTSVRIRIEWSVTNCVKLFIPSRWKFQEIQAEVWSNRLIFSFSTQTRIE